MTPVRDDRANLIVERIFKNKEAFRYRSRTLFCLLKFRYHKIGTNSRDMVKGVGMNPAPLGKGKK